MIYAAQPPKRRAASGIGAANIKNYAPRENGLKTRVFEKGGTERVLC
jgi:hypothetical protein